MYRFNKDADTRSEKTFLTTLDSRCFAWQYIQNCKKIALEYCFLADFYFLRELKFVKQQFKDNFQQDKSSSMYKKCPYSVIFWSNNVILLHFDQESKLVPIVYLIV